MENVGWENTQEEKKMSFEPRSDKYLDCMWQHHSVWLSNRDLRAEERREKSGGHFAVLLPTKSP